MIKTIRELGYTMIVASFVKSDPIFDLTNTLDPLENLRTIRNDYLDEKQKEILIQFLQNNKIDVTGLSDEEISRISRKTVKNKLDELYQAIQSKSVTDDNSFKSLNDVLYENMEKYFNATPDSGKYSIEKGHAIRLEIVTSLVIDLKYLEKLFGNSFNLNRYEERLFEAVENNKPAKPTRLEILRNTGIQAIHSLRTGTRNSIQNFRGMRTDLQVLVLLHTGIRVYNLYYSYERTRFIHEKYKDVNMITSNLSNTCPADRGFLYGNCDTAIHRNIRYFG